MSIFPDIAVVWKRNSVCKSTTQWGCKCRKEICILTCRVSTTRLLVPLSKQLVILFSCPKHVDLESSNSSSSCLLIPQKSISEFQQLVIFFNSTSYPKQLVILKSCPKQVNLPSSNNSAACLLDPNKSTCRVPTTRHLVFLSKASRVAEFRQLIILSSRPKQIDSTTRLLVFLTQTSRLTCRVPITRLLGI